MTDRKREMGSTICILNGQGLVAPQASLSRVRSNLFQVLQCFDDLGTVRTLHFHATSWNHPFLSLWHDSVRAGQTFPAAFPGQVWPTSQGWRNGQFVQPYRTPKRIRTYQLASKIPSQSEKFVRGINFKLRLHQRKWRRKVDCASILLRTCNEGHTGITGSPGHLYAGTPATSLQGHTALTYSSGKMCLKNSSYSIVPLWSSSNLNCTWAYKQYVCWVCRRTWKSHTHTSLVQA